MPVWKVEEISMDFSIVKKRWQNHVPQPREIIPVYATLVFFLYTWMLMHFFWKVPSWLYFLSVGEILNLLAYSLFVNLIESIVFTLFIVGICLLIPAKLLHGKFVACAGVLGFLLLLWIAAFDLMSAWIVLSKVQILAWLLCVILSVALFMFFVIRFPSLQKIVTNICDRFIVFLYLAIPLSLLGGCVFFAQFLFGLEQG